LLAAHHFKQLSALVDKLIRDRVPSDGKPRPDALLNALIGRTYLKAGQEAAAAAYLDHASLDELPPPMRAATALDHARALELRGNGTAAAAAYREAAAISQTEDQRQQAAIGLARQMLVRDPAAARQQLLPMATGAASPHRWEARYLVAITSSLLGDSAAAGKWAGDAWADALLAPPDDMASLRVETLRAGLAATAHDAESERAMLAVTNGLNLVASPSLSVQLPVCGDDGVRPSDFVIFGYVSGPLGLRELLPIAASRPDAVFPFMDRLSGTEPITVEDGRAAAGTVFTAACRTVVNSDFVSKSFDDDPLLDWTYGRGLYPAALMSLANDQDVNSIGAWIDSLSQRFGSDSPLLIYPRWQLLYLLQAMSKTGAPVLPGQLSQLQTEVAAGIRHAGGPEWIASAIEWQSQMEQLTAAAGDASEPSQDMQVLFRKELNGVPFNIARAGLQGYLSRFEGDWPAAASQLVLELNARATPTLSVRERQAWEMTVAEALHNSGKVVEAQRALSSVGLARDLCVAMDSRATLLEQHFSYDNYPEELQAGEQEGAVLFEFGLSTNGTVANPRIIYSLPANLFDQASAKGLSSVRYSVQTKGGKPSACRGIYQPIVWKLEDATDMSVPDLTPQSPGPTT
jgi:hypothetical protein